MSAISSLNYKDSSVAAGGALVYVKLTPFALSSFKEYSGTVAFCQIVLLFLYLPQIKGLNGPP